MRSSTALLAPLLITLAACGDSAPQPPDDTVTGPGFAALELPADAQLHLVLTTQVTIEEYDVHDEGPGDTKRVSDAARSEWWIAADGTFVERHEDQGLALETVVQDGTAWRRVGAVSADIPAFELPSVLASAEDMACLLGWADSWSGLEPIPGADAVYVGEGRPERRVFADAGSSSPSRIETYPVVAEGAHRSANPLATVVVQGRRALDAGASGDVPAEVLRSVPGPGRLTETRITIESAEIVTGDDVRRPSREAPVEPTIGEPVRRERRAANVVFSEHSGPLTDVPRLEVYIRKGLAAAKASPEGALGLEFDRYPQADRHPAMRLVVPVSLSHDEDAADLPAGILSRSAATASVVAVPYRGALPASEADLAAVIDAVRALGLEPDGPVRILLPTSLASTADGQLDLEIEVPVRERD